MKRILIISLLTLTIGGTAGYYYLHSVNEQSEQITPRQHQTTQSLKNNNKTVRQLLTERAETLHGRNVRVEVDNGFYGGAYQVTVWTDYHNYVYAAEVNEQSQKITAWKPWKI